MVVAAAGCEGVRSMGDEPCQAEVRFVKNNHGFPYQAVCYTCGVMGQTVGSREIAEDAVARHVADPNGRLIPTMGDPGSMFYRAEHIEYDLPWDMQTGDRIGH